MLCFLHSHTSRKGRVFSNASCVKRTERPTPGFEYIENILAMLKSKVQRINAEINGIYVKGIRPRRLGCLLALNHNVQIQVAEFDEIDIEDIDPNDPLPFSQCPDCDNRRLDRNMMFDHKRDEAYYVISCDNCGWSEWTQ